MKKIHNQNVAALGHYIIVSTSKSQVPALKIQEFSLAFISLGLLKPPLIHLV